jgi:undecaprenyl diphosphate synthase
MDGNGRWAQKNTLGRISGHRKGAESVRTAVETCRELGIQYLTLYAFSVENWSRPLREIKSLMNLLGRFLKSELKTMLKNDIRLTAIGQIDSLFPEVKDILLNTIDATKHCKSMTLNLALSYGGRDEILGAVKGIIDDITNGRIKLSDVTKDSFTRYLDTKDMPDPDLLIRTSGEYRLSNFLLWQSAYTELYFTDIFWPDFRRVDLIKAIIDYQTRERRFGMTSEQLSKD